VISAKYEGLMYGLMYDVMYDVNRNFELYFFHPCNFKLLTSGMSGVRQLS
jgi:hypothetical protein